MKNELTAKRLSLALSNSNMKPQELADKSGVSKASISQYVNGSHAPSNISSGKMAPILNVNPLWLMGFDVPMNELPTMPHTDLKKSDLTANYNLHLQNPIEMVDRHELNFLEKYRELDSHGKEMVDFTLTKEYERSIAEKKRADNIIPIGVRESTAYEVNAAHKIPGASAEDQKHDDDIMNSDDF